MATTDLYTAQRALARRRVELRQRIDESGDPDLLELMEQHDFLWMSHEGTREIHGEWAALARKIHPSEDCQDGCAACRCDCDICAISRVLRSLAEQSQGKP